VRGYMKLVNGTGSPAKSERWESRQWMFPLDAGAVLVLKSSGERRKARRNCDAGKVPATSGNSQIR
jgi:hypothetical protein